MPKVSTQTLECTRNRLESVSLAWWYSISSIIQQYGNAGDVQGAKRQCERFRTETPSQVCRLRHSPLHMITLTFMLLLQYLAITSQWLYDIPEFMQVETLDALLEPVLTPTPPQCITASSMSDEAQVLCQVGPAALKKRTSNYASSSTFRCACCCSVMLGRAYPFTVLWACLLPSEETPCAYCMLHWPPKSCINMQGRYTALHDWPL